MTGSVDCSSCDPTVNDGCLAGSGGATMVRWGWGWRGNAVAVTVEMVRWLGELCDTIGVAAVIL